MGMTEKNALINALTLQLADDYGIGIRELKGKIADIVGQYHITVAEGEGLLTDTSTEFLLRKFREGKKSVGMSDGAVKQYMIAVQKLLKYSGKELIDVEAEDMTKFLIEYGKTVSKVTLRNKYNLLSSVFNFLYQRRFITYNPIQFTEAPKPDVIYKTPLSEGEFEKIKHACENLPETESLRDMALVYFLASTGCRIGEVQKLRLRDIDFAGKTCRVFGKGRKERPVIISDRAMYRLTLYLESRSELTQDSPLFASIRDGMSAVTVGALQDVVNKLRSITGIKKLTCHVFRRFYATELRKRNVPLQMIATSLGHANLNQINRYSVYDRSEMASIIRKSV